jgi:hypothetical protein
MAEPIHINTISRREAKKLAPSGYRLRKKIGGFIAYKSIHDIPSIAKKSKYPYQMSDAQKQMYIDKHRNREYVASVDNIYFPFRTREAYLRSMN